VLTAVSKKLYIANRETLGFYGGSFLQQLLPRISRLFFNPSNDITNARMNASFHYDTSNDVFSGFLSQDMNYSSAIWSEDSNEALESAQQRKVHNIIDKARISSSDHVLDIGCGWGDLAIEAVKRTGCRVTGLTLSAEQRVLAQKRIKAAGLEGQITIILCDYRQAPKPDGGYDRIVSVEMLEHVGNKFMIQYFESISSLLKRDNGIMVVQGITMTNSVSTSRVPNSFSAGVVVAIVELAHA
jgi:cyclopropane-fatty-acyl-phospholipid synthase